VFRYWHHNSIDSRIWVTKSSLSCTFWLEFQKNSDSCYDSGHWVRTPLFCQNMGWSINGLFSICLFQHCSNLHAPSTLFYITTNFMILGTRQNLLEEGKKWLILFYSTTSNKEHIVAIMLLVSRQQATSRQPASHQQVTIKQQQMTIKQQQKQKKSLLLFYYYCYCYYYCAMPSLAIADDNDDPSSSSHPPDDVEDDYRLIFFTLSFVYFVWTCLNSPLFAIK